MKMTGVLLLLLFAAKVSCAQERIGADTADTAKTTGITILDAGLSTGKASLLLPPELQYEEFGEETPLFLLWKRTSVVPPLIGGLGEPKADLTAPLRAQWAKDAQMSTLRTVLGTVQISAVGYLAYRALTSKETPKPIKRK